MAAAAAAAYEGTAAVVDRDAIDLLSCRRAKGSGGGRGGAARHGTVGANSAAAAGRTDRPTGDGNPANVCVRVCASAARVSVSLSSLFRSPSLVRVIVITLSHAGNKMIIMYDDAEYTSI